MDVSKNFHGDTRASFSVSEGMVMVSQIEAAGSGLCRLRGVI